MKFKYTLREVGQLLDKKIMRHKKLIKDEEGRLIKQYDNLVMEVLEKELMVLIEMRSHLGPNDIWLDETELRELLA